MTNAPLTLDGLVISFDIDGTLEVGDPPGLVPLTVVRRAIELGCIVGSCSDRPLSYQQRLWEQHGIEMHFTVLKQHLPAVREAHIAARYLHIGDSLVDRMMADSSGFDFIDVADEELTSFLAAFRFGDGE